MWSKRGWSGARRAKNKESPFASTPQSSWTRAAQLYAREERCTHTIRDLDLELIEDLLNGFHVGLQVPGFRRDRGQRPGQNRVQVEPQDPVHEVAGKRRLERSQSAHVSVVLLSLCARALSIDCLERWGGPKSYFKRLYDALVQKHNVQVVVCFLQRERAVSRWTQAASPGRGPWQPSTPLHPPSSITCCCCRCRLYSHSSPGSESSFL